MIVCERKPGFPVLSAAARRRLAGAEGGPLFLADWTGALMLHYEVEARRLQPFIPLALDRFQGRAFVSVVAFRQERLRPDWGGRLTALLCAPLASHAFLNVRTYVRVNGEAGIFFLAEWIPNLPAALLGPPLYGLPYRLGRLDYRHAEGEVHGEVSAWRAPGSFSFRAAWDASSGGRIAESGSLTEFLMERYTAYTFRKGAIRRFRIWHEPWPQVPAEVEIANASLLSDSAARQAARAENRNGNRQCKPALGLGGMVGRRSSGGCEPLPRRSWRLDWEGPAHPRITRICAN